ncbi:MAG: hypothetical protein ACREMZ_05415 [Gemmatimonadales bacterium]
MRYPILAVAFLAAGLCLGMPPEFAAQSTDQDQAVQGGGTLPAGWTARADGDGDTGNIKFVTMEPGYHLTLGPATILYRQQDRVNGPFHAMATFHQMKKLRHPEGYGLIFGGRALSGKEQKYTYFLVRDDGTYLIKRRDGEKTSEVTKGWTAHRAIKKADARGNTSNLLEIDAKQNPSKVDFKVNGQMVYTADAGALELKGGVGIRANHNLDLHIEDFAVHK